MELGGIHHVTAVTGDAPGNVTFYTDTLGLRLVKKTVNQDDVSAYHLFYGDEIGHPGTEMTFFDWSGIGPHLLLKTCVLQEKFEAKWSAPTASWPLVQQPCSNAEGSMRR